MSPTNPLRHLATYTLGATPRYGPNHLGLFATHNFSAGNQLLTWQQPLLILPSTAPDDPSSAKAASDAFWKAVADLPDAELRQLKTLAFRVAGCRVTSAVRAFEVLARVPETDEEQVPGRAEWEMLVLKTFFAHSHPFAADEAVAEHRLCAHLGFLNHSCAPNAVLRWDAGPGELDLRVIRPVKKGEEITVSYLGASSTLVSREEKRERLGFECACTLCEGVETEVEKKAAYKRLLMLLDCVQRVRAQLPTCELPPPPPPPASHAEELEHWKERTAEIARLAGPPHGLQSLVIAADECASALGVAGDVRMAEAWQLLATALVAWDLAAEEQQSVRRRRQRRQQGLTPSAVMHAGVSAKARELGVVWMVWSTDDARAEKLMGQLSALTEGRENGGQMFCWAMGIAGIHAWEWGGRVFLSPKVAVE